MRRAWLTAVVMFGCHGNEPREPVSEPKPDCASVAETSGRILGGTSVAAHDQVKASVLAHCTTDAWTSTAVTCILNAGGHHDVIYKCAHDHLTGLQFDAVAADISAAMEASKPTTADTTPTEPPPPADDTGGLVITSLYPARGDLAGGDFVVLRGTNFTGEERKAKVMFGAKQATVVRYASDTELIVQTPAGTALGSVDVEVTFEPGGKRLLPDAFIYAKLTSNTSTGGSQATLAAEASAAGDKLVAKKQYLAASEKFRDAAARTNESKYFLKLCIALHSAGRYSEALTACDAGIKAGPTRAEQESLINELSAVKQDAAGQGVKVE